MPASTFYEDLYKKTEIDTYIKFYLASTRPSPDIAREIDIIYYMKDDIDKVYDFYKKFLIKYPALKEKYGHICHDHQIVLTVEFIKEFRTMYRHKIIDYILNE
jgi:hypothetical protein